MVKRKFDASGGQGEGAKDWVGMDKMLNATFEIVGFKISNNDRGEVAFIDFVYNGKKDILRTGSRVVIEQLQTGVKPILDAGDTVEVTLTKTRSKNGNAYYAFR